MWPKKRSESEVAQSCPTLSDPMDCSLPGFSAHGIFQARVLEWGAIAFSSKKKKRMDQSNHFSTLRIDQRHTAIWKVLVLQPQVRKWKSVASWPLPFPSPFLDPGWSIQMFCPDRAGCQYQSTSATAEGAHSVWSAHTSSKKQGWPEMIIIWANIKDCSYLFLMP